MKFKLENNEVIELEIVRKARMKNIYLRVSSKGVVVSTNKRTSQSDIEAFVRSKSAWLSKHIKAMSLQSEKRAIVSGNEVYFLGKAYRLKVVQKSQLHRASLRFEEQVCHLEVPQEQSQEELLELLNKHYKHEAIERVTAMVEQWSKAMDLTPSNIGFRKAKSRWGSCSSQNSLSFNYYLMKLPLEVVEYVVVHELAHIKEKNHSKNFWALVEQYLPDYKERVVKLREFERLI